VPRGRKFPGFHPCETCYRLGSMPGSVSLLAHLREGHGMGEQEAMRFIKRLFELVAEVRKWDTGGAKKGKPARDGASLLERILAPLALILQALLLDGGVTAKKALPADVWGSFRADRISLEDALRKVQR